MERDVDFGLFDVVIESFAVGARKPEPAIYAATQAALGVAPSEIVYLDDFDQNLNRPRRSAGRRSTSSTRSSPWPNWTRCSPPVMPTNIPTDQ